MKYIQKNLTIRKDQNDWLKKNPLNFSKFVQIELDKLIEKGGL